MSGKTNVQSGGCPYIGVIIPIILSLNSAWHLCLHDGISPDCELWQYKKHVLV